MSSDWTIGDEVPCRKGLCTIEVIAPTQNKDNQ